MVADYLQVDGRDSSFTRGQFADRRGVESGNDDAVVLDGFGVVEGRLMKGYGVATFDANDFGDAIGGEEFDLIGGQRRVFGIDVDVHCAETTAAFLTRRLLGAKRRWLRKER